MREIIVPTPVNSKVLQRYVAQRAPFLRVIKIVAHWLLTARGKDRQLPMTEVVGKRILQDDEFSVKLRLPDEKEFTFEDVFSNAPPSYPKGRTKEEPDLQITVWSQARPGGLPTQLIQPTTPEPKEHEFIARAPINADVSIPTPEDQKG